MKSIVLCAALVLTQVNAACAVDLAAPYEPTRAEWLQVELTRTLTGATGSWGRRIGVTVVVISADAAVVVTLTSANGQDQVGREVQARYVDSVRELARSVLKRYPWADGIKLTVQFA